MQRELIAGLAVSFGVGLLIGLERQQAMVRKEGQIAPAGLRTFPLLSLTGSLTWLLGGGSPTLPALALLGVIVVLAAHRLGLPAEHREEGVTTEAAAVVAFLLGMLVVADRLIPDLEARLTTTGALATIVTLLLSIKPRLQAFVRKISGEDLFATLQLLVVALVLFPLLPDEGMGPYDAINPAHTGRMILLIGGVSWVGFVASRLLGAGRGLILTGLVGGLVSSTAVTFSMSRRAKEEPAVVPSCTVAIAAANAMMFARVSVAVAVVAPDLLPVLVMPLGAMFLAGLASLVPLLREVRAARARGSVTHENPFELTSAVVFGLLFAGVVVIAHAVRVHLGDGALILAGLAAGLTDVDAITLSMAGLVRDGGADAATATGAIVIAALANTLVKCGIIVGTAAAALRARVVVVTLLLVAAALASLWIA